MMIKSMLAYVIGYAIVVILYPLLIIVWIVWREHERRVLCDGGVPGA